MSRSGFLVVFILFIGSEQIVSAAETLMVRRFDAPMRVGIRALTFSGYFL